MKIYKNFKFSYKYTHLLCLEHFSKFYQKSGWQPLILIALIFIKKGYIDKSTSANMYFNIFMNVT